MKANEIKNALYSGQLSLSESLRCTQELLEGRGDSEVLAWIKNEWDGYADDAILPEYRKILCEVYVEYEDPIYGTKIVSVDANEFEEIDEEEKLHLYRMHIGYGIEQLEKRLLNKESGDITKTLKGEKYNVLKGKVANTGGMMVRAYQQAELSCLKSIISFVRQRLLDVLHILKDKEEAKSLRVLEVSRYKNNFVDHQLPFVTEQGEAIRDYLNRGLVNGDCKMVNEPSEVEYFLIKGNYLKARKALMAKIREWKPDIIHAHYGLSAIVAEMQSEVPVVTTFHNGETHRWYVNLLASLFSLRAKHVIYVAQHIRDLSYFNAKHYSIIPCGVSLEDCFLMDKEEARKQLKWDAKKKYILFGGAFGDVRKNYPLLKEAVEKLEGDIECIEMRGLTREECVLRMNACDVFALPTKNEGSPQALKEAMACNCPIVATDVADIKHLLGGLQGHYLLPNKQGNAAWWKGDEHSAEELAELLKKALAFEGRTEGRTRIVELGYTNEMVAKKIVKIYEDIIKK